MAPSKRTERQKAVSTKRRQNTEKSLEVQKEKATANIARLLKAGKRVQKKHVRYTVKFKRPKTLQLKRAPKYPRKSTSPRIKMDKYRILKAPMNSESAMKMIEEQNTLVFLTDLTATKKQISRAFKEMYEQRPAKVRTLIRPTGEKKAYIKMPKDVEAVDIASKVGLI